MQSNQSHIKPEQRIEFAHAWVEHRKESAAIHSVSLYPHIINTISPSKGGKILDLGCGSGELCLRIREALTPLELTGIDINAHLLERFRESYGQGVNLYCQDIASTYPIATESVDGLVCSNVVMHLSDPECQSVCNEISRVLSPRGVAALVFTHPLWAAKNYAEDPNSTLRYEVTRRWNGLEFVQHYRSASDYRDLIANAGLSVASEKVVAIPELPGLGCRYAKNTGHPIFMLFELRPLAPK